jgi:cation transport regulator ChaC
MSESVWSFGYGSNMNPRHLEDQKGVKVLDHTPAILKGYRLTFEHKGMPLVEPSFATVKEGAPSDEVHGVAFLVSKSDYDRLDKIEVTYEGCEKNFEAYDGRVITGLVFMR